MFKLSLFTLLLIVPIYAWDNHTEVNLIKEELLPERLEEILDKIRSECKKDIEMPMRRCLSYYQQKISHHQDKYVYSY